MKKISDKELAYTMRVILTWRRQNNEREVRIRLGGMVSVLDENMVSAVANITGDSDEHALWKTAEWLLKREPGLQADVERELDAEPPPPPPEAFIRRLAAFLATDTDSPIADRSVAAIERSLLRTWTDP